MFFETVGEFGEGASGALGAGPAAAFSQGYQQSVILVVHGQLSGQGVSEELLDIAVVDVIVEQMVPPKNATSITVYDEGELFQAIEQD